jgi:2'-hydroxyisoflavone reductase
MEKVLIIGGTNFIGRNLILALLQIEKYEITLFNRGTTNADLFPKLNRIKGDRNTDEIKKIIEHDWDYIIDISCYLPTSLKRIINSLKYQPKKYIFISTCSVYDIDESILKNEKSILLNCSDEAFQNTEMYKYYGNKKVACEQLLEKSELNYTVLRPALVYGAFDHTDRFYYWLHQVHQYDNILMPNNGKDQFSLTYVQDLVQAIVCSIEPDLDREVYNITSFPMISIKEIVDIASKILNKESNYINASSLFLNEQSIQKWSEMPLWLDCDFFTFDNKKILESYNISLVPLEKSIKATILYYEKLGWKMPVFGINREKQEELISIL